MDYLANEIEPDIVLVLGDLVYGASHNKTKEKEIEVIKTVTDMLKDTFNKSSKPNTLIYPVFGNHEGFPADRFDYRNIENEMWLLKPTAEMWKDWLGPKAIEEYMKAGYYSVEVPHIPKLRIIALNSLLYEVMNFVNVPNATDPGNQLYWLEKTLEQSEKNHEHVFIFSHIPSCCDRGAQGTTYRMQALFERYSNIIKGMFSGHYHRDFFRVLRSAIDDTPYAIEFIVPSVST